MDIILNSEGAPLYTQEDFQKNRAQLRRRLTWIMIPAAVLLGLVVWSFILRVKWLTMALSVVLGSGLIFAYGMFLSPIIAYGRHLQQALTGRTRSLAGAFKEMEESAVAREGVMYYPMLVSVGDMAEPEDDRLFYYDANISRPSFQVGERLTITAHDKFVTAWSRV